MRQFTSGFRLGRAGNEVASGRFNGVSQFSTEQAQIGAVSVVEAAAQLGDPPRFISGRPQGDVRRDPTPTADILDELLPPLEPGTFFEQEAQSGELTIEQFARIGVAAEHDTGVPGDQQGRHRFAPANGPERPPAVNQAKFSGLPNNSASRPRLSRNSATA